MPQVAGFFAGMVGFGTAGAIATGVATSAWASGWVLGASIGSTVVGGLVGKLLTSVALSALQQALGPKPAQGGGITISTTLRGEQNPETIILGRTATAGQAICPPYSHGKSNRWLTHVIELCSAPGATLERLILNDDYVEIGSAPMPGYEAYGLPILGDFEGGYAFVKYYDGSQTAADPMLLDKYGSHPDRPWTAAMIGSGLCYAILTFYYDQEVCPQVPRYRFEMQGIPLYDIRKDSTAGGSGPQRLANPATWTQTDNPLVMSWNLLHGIPLPGGEIYGGGEPVEVLPTVNWVAAMNACDVAKPIKGGGTEPAYRAGLEIALTTPPASALEELLKAASATIADVGYAWKVQVGAPALPVYSLTDDDVIVSKPQDYDPFPALGETHNGVTAQYPDPASLWETKEAPPRYNPAWEAADVFGRRVADLSLPAVPYKRQVQRLMRAWIEDERRFRRHMHWLPADASAVEPLDTLDWSSQRNGYSSKDFSVSETVEDLRTGLKQVSIRERDPADYDWSADFELPDTPGTTGTTPTVEMVSGFGVQAVKLFDADGRPRRVGLRLVWDAGLDASAIRWRIRLAGQPGVILRGGLPDLSAGEITLTDGILPATAYEASARLISGRVTAWSDWYAATTDALKLGPADLDWSQLENEILEQVEDLQQWVDGEVGSLAEDLAAEAEARGDAVQALADDLADRAQELSDEVAERASNIRDLARRYRQVTRSVDNLRDWVADLDYRRYREKEQLRTDLSRSLREFRATFEETVTVAASERAAITQRVTSLEAESLDTRAQILAVETARVAGENALAQAITGMSVGTVTQFDTAKIWYYDDDAEGWTGTPAAPTVADGYMRLADGAGATGTSPAGLAIRAVRYSQLRARVKRVGAPAWTGWLWWAAEGQAFAPGRRVAIPEPTWSGDDGLITVTPGWAGTIDRIRLELVDTADATKHVLIDWIAIGRPSPGATSAELVEERTARMTADSAQAAAIADLEAEISDTRGELAATAGAVEAVEIRVTETEAAVTAQGTALIALEAAMPGKASSDAVQALEARTSETETAIRTGSRATTSLRAVLLPLASDVLDQTYAEFLGRQKVRKAVAEADQTLGAQIRAVDDRLILTADAVTRLELELPKLASATALDAVRLRMTSAEDKLVIQGEAITSFTAALAGKASGSALDTLGLRVTETETGLGVLGTALTSLGAALAGKASTDAVQALEARTSETETAIRTGGQATTSLRAVLLLLASDVLDQTYAEFLGRQQVRKAVAEADQTLGTQIRAVDDRLILTADAVTRLELELPKLASATALDAVRLRMTSAEDKLVIQGEAITSLGASLAGKASGSALEALTLNVSEIGGVVLAQAEALSALTVSAGKYSAAGRFRTTVEATPEGASARIGLSVAAGPAAATATAALFLEADSSGNSSVLVRADRFAVTDGSVKKALLIVEDGEVYLRSAFIKAASIGSLEIAGNAVTIPVRTFAAATVDITGTGWVTVATLRIRRKGFATEFNFSASVDGYGNGTLDFVLTRGSDNTIVRRAGFTGAPNGRQTQVAFSSVDWDTGTGSTVYRIRARKPDPSVTAGWDANMRIFRRYFSAVQFQR